MEEKLGKVLKLVSVAVDEKTEEELAWLCATTKEPPSVVLKRAVHMWVAIRREERGSFPEGKGFEEFLEEDNKALGLG